MIVEDMQRNLNALRRQLGPFAHNLPPLVLPLLDSLEDKLEDVARLEGAAMLNFEPHKAEQGEEHEQQAN